MLTCKVTRFPEIIEDTLALRDKYFPNAKVSVPVSYTHLWNLWHGCHKLSAGCKHCYVYRGDARREVDSSVVVRTKNFDLPLRKKRNGEFKIGGKLTKIDFKHFQHLYDEAAQGKS